VAQVPVPLHGGAQAPSVAPALVTRQTSLELGQAVVSLQVAHSPPPAEPPELPPVLVLVLVLA